MVMRPIIRIVRVCSQRILVHLTVFPLHIIVALDTGSRAMKYEEAAVRRDMMFVGAEIGKGGLDHKRHNKYMADMGG